MNKRGPMKKCVIGGLIFATALGISFSTPAQALTWNVDKESWSENVYLPSTDSWKNCLNIEGIKSTGYVNYDDEMAVNVCYCDAPARVTLLEYTNNLGDVVSYASPWGLGSSIVNISITDDGEIVKGELVNPTFCNAVVDEEYGNLNGAGTYWDLNEGIYYMSSAEASKMLYLVVGDPFAVSGDAIGDITSNETLVFDDVPLDAYYYEPVNWAIENAVTSGTSATTFSPNETCTQAQILTFLWKTAKEFNDTITDNPYNNSNITEDKYYYKAMLWAWDRGVIDDADLNPEAECKRSDVVKYLWKISGKPTADISTAFIDVPTNSDYADAVKWAVDAGITSGTGADTFSPDESCTRGQIVTFLYHYFAD